jgi:hypothetical protein
MYSLFGHVKAVLQAVFVPIHAGLGLLVWLRH